MSCHTRFQRGLVLLPAVPRLLEHPVLPALSPAQGLWACGQPQEADEGFGSSAKPKANSGALTPSKPQEQLSAGCAAPKAPGAPGLEDGAGAALPRGSLLQVESAGGRGWMHKSLHQEQHKSRQALQMPSLATPCPPPSAAAAAFLPGSNLGKMKLSIMHLSPRCSPSLARTSAESPHV